MGPLSKTVLIAAAIVYLASTLGAVFAPQAVAPPPALPTPPASTNPQPAGASIVGFAINFHHTDDVAPFLRAVDELASLGFNAVEVLTPAFQRDGVATEISVQYGPGLSPRRDDLLALLRHAKARGMTTPLMPRVVFTNPRGNEWRGKINPEDWDAWWVSYRRNLDYFIDIAREADVDILMVGSELISTERQIDRWQELIAYARSRFSGALTYSTNWDHYQYPAFWPLLDMIGINGYWEISGDAEELAPWPQLQLRWRRIRHEVASFAHRTGRPVLLTEIGYPSLPWALKDPWNYVNADDTPAAPSVQALGYAAFLSAWCDVIRPHPVTSLDESAGSPATVASTGDARETVDAADAASPVRDRAWIKGVYFYSWDPYGKGARDDTGYGVQGKPALDLLRRWLTTGQAPPAPDENE